MMDQVSITPSPKAPEAQAVVEFWKQAGPQLWFAKDAKFDQRFRETFARLYARATRAELEDWLDSANSALSLILLLDQYPRNSFRGTPRMYESDQLAVHYTNRAIERGHDRNVEEAMQFFFYLPLGHSESLAEQERCVALNRRLGGDTLEHALGHAAIVRRFGRFPHRNPILGRPSSEAELEFLRQGGFAG
jgi:uncharacterized protein (DUF924 family)